MQFAHQFHHRFTVGRVEVSGRLVSEQDAGLSTDCACDCDALLLTAGQLAGQVLRTMRHADSLECFSNAFLAFAGAHAAISQRQFDVLINGQVADEVEALKDKSDLAVSDPCALGERKILDRVAVEDVLTVRRCIQQSENRKQG